jgi:hypothetical protein
LHHQHEEGTMWFTVTAIVATEAMILTIAIRARMKGHK